MRVPLIVRWPGVTKPGMLVPQMVSNLDLFPTLLAMAGLKAPREIRVEGEDITPLLRGNTKPGRDILFFQYDLHNTASARMRGARTESWKYVRRFDAARLDELYDLSADPDESRNLIPANPTTLKPELEAVRKDLDRRLLEWMRSIDDPLLSSASARAPGVSGTR